MSTTKWTKEQQQAIETSGCSLLVAAAAGAGKTAVLVERIIRKITDERNPVDIDRLLIVTFTNAAAAEMRERIGDAIAKALDSNPESKSLQRQMTLLHKASITTIHSFCLEVIRNNFHTIDLDPGFRIADQTEAALLKMEALEELFEESYEREEMKEEFLQLVECYGGGRDDSMVQEIVLSLHEFVQSHPWPDKWLEEKSGAFNLNESSDFGSTSWAKILKKSIGIELHGVLNAMHRAVHIAKYSEGLSPYLDNFNSDILTINELIKNCCREDGDNTWDCLYNAFSNLEFTKLARCGKNADKDRQEQAKAIRDEVKKRLKKIQGDIFKYRSNEIIAGLNRLYPVIRCLSQLVLEFDQRYCAKKKTKSLLDFNDLEHMCLRILTTTDEEGNILPSKAAMAYRSRFEEILVDEYQDSNLVQEVLLSMISRKDSDMPNLFMVGDVKQSIYRFRQAKPELFLEKYNSYSREDGKKERKIQLFKNFRSREEVINGVNYIFKQIMSVNVGELEYTDEEALNLGASYEKLEDPSSSIGGTIEVNLIDLSDEAVADMETDNAEDEAIEEADEPSREEEQIDSIQAEARIVVKRIKELMKPDDGGKVFKVYDKELKAYRQVDFKDIVILLRTTRNWSDVFMEELGAQGIPAYADTGTGYFKTIEVQTVMSLLQIIDNPIQDIPLLAVLRSPITSFTPEELIDIRLADKEASIYEAMVRLASDGENLTAGKAKAFLQSLKKWRDKALHMSTDELIWYLYSDTGYYSFAGAMPGGVQRQANLRVLFERARQYDETSYKGLFNFINFINKLKNSRGDMGSAKVLGENENVVRIMSIHKSKGLEFPVVILAGAGKQFNLQDMNRSILLHQDLGFGPDFVDHNRRISYPTVAKQALRYKIKLESLSEEMRVLYVAFTRAKEKLIITGALKNARKTLAKWCSSLDVKEGKLPEYELLSGKNYLDWIGPAVMRHKGCDAMRNLALADEGRIRENLCEDPSMWEVRLWSKGDIITGKAREAKQEQDLLDSLDRMEHEDTGSGFGEEIRKRLDWEYRYKRAFTLPTKLTVTELKRRFSAELSEELGQPMVYLPALVKKPAFMEETKGLSAAEAGSAMHFVLQHLDLKRVSSKAEIEQQIEGMVKADLITPQQAGAVKAGKIERFFNSSLGQRMVKAEKVYREIPFNMELPCTDIYKEIMWDCREDTILLQGVIDCYFEEKGQIVLLDYKTDYVPYDGLEIIKERYRVQIGYYTRALEQITGMRVGERNIYLFGNGEIIKY